MKRARSDARPVAGGRVAAPFVYVTGNPGKLAESRRVVGPQLEAVAVDLPEIQSLDFREVLRAKADEAWRHVGRPLVVEEAGLELAAMNGFPGPLVKWMLAAVGAEGIARAAHAFGDDRATARALLLYRDGERELVAEGVTAGRVVPAPRGDRGFGFDPVFEPEWAAGEYRGTYAELDDAAKDEIGHRGRAWRVLLQLLAR